MQMNIVDKILLCLCIFHVYDALACIAEIFMVHRRLPDVKYKRSYVVITFLAVARLQS